MLGKVDKRRDKGKWRCNDSWCVKMENVNIWGLLCSRSECRVIIILFEEMTMGETPPPAPPTGLLMKRCKFIWRLLLLSNLALGGLFMSLSPSIIMLHSFIYLLPILAFCFLFLSSVTLSSSVFAFQVFDTLLKKIDLLFFFFFFFFRTRFLHALGTWTSTCTCFTSLNSMLFLYSKGKVFSPVIVLPDQAELFTVEDFVFFSNKKKVHRNV